MDTWTDEGNLFEGSCGWSFNPYVTATVVDTVEEVVQVETVVDVVVEGNYYI